MIISAMSITEIPEHASAFQVSSHDVFEGADSVPLVLKPSFTILPDQNKQLNTCETQKTLQIQPSPVEQTDYFADE